MVEPAVVKASPRRGWRWALGAPAVLFGAATLVEGGTTLFGGPEARAAAGAVVPFVVAFNFSAGFVYVAAGVTTVAGRPVAVWLARALAVGTLVVFLALGVQVAQGGAHKARTIYAMTVRTLFWGAQALALARVLPRRPGA